MLAGLPVQSSRSPSRAPTFASRTPGQSGSRRLLRVTTSRDSQFTDPVHSVGPCSAGPVMRQITDGVPMSNGQYPRFSSTLCHCVRLPEAALARRASLAACGGHGDREMDGPWVKISHGFDRFPTGFAETVAGSSNTSASEEAYLSPTSQ